METNESIPQGERLILSGIPKPLKVEIQNIARNLGVTTTSFLKPKLRDIVKSYPENMRVAEEG